MKNSMNFIQEISLFLEREQSQWVLWIPVGLSIGIAGYMALPFEPPSWSLFFGIFPGFLLMKRQGSFLTQFSRWSFFWTSIGFLLMVFYSSFLSPTMLFKELPPLWIEGKIEAIDHPASSHRLFQRLTLKVIKTTSSLVPYRVLITVLTPSTFFHEGDRVRLKASLRPFPGPCFPGAYHPRKSAFFKGIGATGFALSVPQLLKQTPSFWATMRHTLTRRIYTLLPSPLDAVGCGFITGDKIGLPEEVRLWFSESGLAHLLAIAGLHISLLSGLCFWIVQKAILFFPKAGLYCHTDKVAAFFSLGAGWCYFMVSGQRIPAHRAFFMMSATMVAMVLGRRRHPMRILMLWASFFLLTSPQSLLTVSYQLSFSAVAGLLAFYGRERSIYKMRLFKKKNLFTRSRSFILESFLATAAITGATFPIMAFHFLHFSLQGFLSNLIAIPFTAFCVIPLGLLALFSLATPFAPFFFTLWGWTLKIVLMIAQFSAVYLSFLVVKTPPLSPFIFFAEMLGMMWFLLWHSSWRWGGLAVTLFLTSFGPWLWVWKPTFFIDSSHKLVGYKEGTTLWISSLRNGRFTRKKWMDAFGCTHCILLPSPSFFSLPGGKRAALFYKHPSLQQCSQVDFYLAWRCKGKVPPLPHLCISCLLPLHSYLVEGAGRKIRSSYERRPWNPSFKGPCFPPQRGNLHKKGKDPERVL